MTRKKTNKQAKPRKSRQSLVFEELEPRLLLSADLPIDMPAVLAPDRGDDEPVSIYEEITSAAASEEQSATRELVFVDTDTSDYQTLVDDLVGNSGDDRLIEVVLLDNSSDGIAQITDTLAQYNELDAVHIISHGSEGTIDLGGTRLEFDTLLANTTSIQGWANAFTENGDLLIYGCNLTASADGQALVDSLARLTGADVAASNDLTGSAEKGGDWDLEFQAGQIETEVFFSADAQQAWSGLLAETVHTSHENVTNTIELKSDNNSGQTFSYTSGNGTYDVNQISLQLNRDADTTLQNVTVSLRTSWDGPDLASGTISSSSLSTSMSWETFDIGNVTLNDGQTYLIRVSTDSIDGKIWLGDDSSGTYANGDKIDVNGSPLGGEDLAFRVIETTQSNTGTAIWGESGSNFPEYSAWDGTSFGAEGTAYPVGQWRITQGAESPQRDEKIVVGVDSSGNIEGMLWNGSTWSQISVGGSSIFGTVSQSYWWGMDVQYESQSGDALMVWTDGSNIEYATWDGTNWSSVSTLGIYSGATPRQLQLAASPDSDEMVLVVSDSNSADTAYVWNGTSWGNAVTLDSGSGDNRSDVNVVYQQQSGDAVVVYGAGSTSIQARVWDGTNWGTPLAFAAPGGASGNVLWTAIDADPNSDAVAVSVVTAGGDIWAGVLDGSWSPNLLSGSSSSTVAPTADVAFESNSGELLVAYAESGSSNVKYVTWSSGGGWSVEQTGPNVGATPNSLTLDSDPTSDRVMLSAQDSGSDLNYVLWDGGSWGTPTELEINSGETKNQPFLFLWDQDVQVNDAPVNTVPATQDTAVDTPLVFSTANGNPISVADADDTSLEVTLAGTSGTLTLNSTTGLSFSSGDGSADASMTFTGALADINAALDGLQFDPTAAFEGFASVQISTTDFGGSGAGSPKSDVDAVTIEVGDVNTAPVNTVPATQTIDQDGMLLFSSATGTAISISDADASGATVQVTLTATNGTINLQSTQGLSFSTGDGSADATMIFTGTVTDINAALDGMTFVATAGYTGSAGVQITTNDLGNSGAGGAQSDTDNVAITVAVPDHTLWMTFENDESATGNTELPDFSGGDVVNFGGTLTFESGTTSGTFSKNFNLDLVAGTDGATDVDAVHYLTRDISVGGINLQTGDLLLSTSATEVIGGVTYNKEDVFVFRPTTAGDYSAGSFFMLIEGKNSGVVGNVTGISLVEQSTVVGGVTLNAGDFLIAEGSKDIVRFEADQLGATTTGTTSILVQGADIDFGQNIGALHLVQQDTAIGDTSLQAGQLLVGLVSNDSTVGDTPTINVLRQDLFVLDVTATGAGTTAATATRFFEGLDENLDTNNESIWGVSAQYNVAPTANDATFALDENSANGTVVGSVTATDPENGSIKFAITGGNTNGAFTIDAATGQITVANSTALDFETTSSFSLSVAAIDDQGAYDNAVVTINLNNLDEGGINDAPENTIPADQTIDKGGMLLFSSATGTAISVSDFDAGSNPVQVMLKVDSGTLSLPSTLGLTFSTGDGSNDPLMTFTGTIADINAALEGATFVATPGFIGTAAVQIITNDLGNTGTGGALSDTDSVAITVQAADQQLWLTFENDQAGTGNSDIPNVTAGDVVTFGDITQLETSNSDPLASTTSGTLAYGFNLDTVLLSDGVTLASDGNTIVNVVHYVTRDIQVGSNNIQLLAGDILLSTDADENIDGVTYNNNDVFVFRPDTAGDYSQGSFFLLIDGNAASLNLNNITGISLVEQTTSVGGVTLNAGEFLFAHDGSGKNILRYIPGTLGATTTGTASVLIAGADINIGQNIGGLHLVQNDTVIGGKSLSAGQLLVSIQGNDTTVGDATTIAALRQDIFILDVTATGTGTSAATAQRFFEGLDENLDTNNESIWGIGYQGNTAPTINADIFALDENSANATVVGSVTASDPENGALQYAIIAGNTDGAFAIDATTGQITVANSAVLDYETTPTFTLTVAAIDPEGAYDTAVITVNLSDIDEANDAPSFTSPGDGDVTTAVDTGTDYGYSVTVQPDGKVLVGGYAQVGGNYDFVVTRYNTDGSLDTTFGGGDGIATIAMGPGSDLGYEVLLQPDGKILMVGAASNGVDNDFAMTRLNSDGTLDTSFGGGDGIVTTDVSAEGDIARAAVIQPDGKIVLGGFARIGGDNNFALVRYNSDGTIDTTFGGGDGIVTTAVPSFHSHINDIALQPDGKIVAFGDSQNGSGSDFAVVRYNADGSLDTSFGGGDGIAITAVGTGNSEQESLLVQSDGKILAGGYAYNGTDYDFAVVRYNTDGSLDTSFGGGDGIAMIPIGSGDDRATGMALLADGKIMLSGYSDNGTDNDFAVVRLNSDGTLDTSFGGGDGYITADVGGANDISNGMAVADDGTVYLAGSSYNGSNLDLALQSYTADGSLDTTFDRGDTLDGTPTFTEGGAPVVLDADVEVYDQELTAADNFDGASLILVRNGGASSDDVFSATGTLAALFEGGSLVVGGTTIGTVTTNSGGALVLTFNANATNTLVNQAMQQIAYSNTSDAPPASVQVDWTFDDGNTGAQGTGGALQGYGSITVDIVATNDDPVLTLPAGNVAYTEGAFERIASTATLTDVDSADFDGGQLTVTIASGGEATDYLYIFTSGNVLASGTNLFYDFGAGDVQIGTISYGVGDPLIVTFNTNATAAAIEDVIQQVFFHNTTDDPSTTSRIVDFEITDGDGGTSGIQSRTVDITAINDAPVITSDGGGATAMISVQENTAAVTDVDATDAEGDTLNYSISGGTDAALFTINASTGALSFISAPDFENPADAGADNVYNVTVEVSDGNAGTDTQAITVNVIDMADGIRVTPIDVVPIGDETLVNTTTTDNQLIAAGVHQGMATDANGNYIVIWGSNLQDGSGWGIYAQRYSADGTAVGSEFLVTTTTADNQLNPAVAMDDAGNFVITWQSNLQDGDSYGVYAQRYSADGTAVGSEFLVNTTTTGYQGSPTIAMDADGDFVIAWVANGQDPDASLGIYAQRFDASGTAQGSEFRVNTYTTGTQQITSMGMDAAGNFVVIWASENQDGSNYGIFGQRFDASGNALGSEFQVNTTTINSQLYHDVVMLDDGRFVVEYQSRNADGSFEVFMQRYAADGSTVGGEIQVNTTTVSSAQQPIGSITADESGNITVVWNSDADGDGTAVVGQRFDWAGNKFGGEFIVNTTTAGNQIYPEVIAQAGGGFIVAWGGNGAGDADGVFMQRYGMSVSEEGVSATFQIVLESAPTADVTIPISVSDPTEGTVSVGSVTFTTSDWNTPQTVTITGVQDFTIDGNQVFQVILGAATSTDPNFNGLDLADLTILNTELPNQAPSGLPTITGTVEEDQVLTADTSGISDPDGLGTFSYQWYRDGMLISGATASTYTLGDDDVGAQISVAVSYTDVRGSSEGPLMSAQTGPVINVNDAPELTNGTSTSYGEGSGATPFLTATLTDIDSADFDGGTLTFSIASGGDGTDVLRLGIMNGVTVSGDNVYVDGVLVGTKAGGTSGTDYTISLNSSATPARVQTLFQNLIIVSTGDNPTTGVRNLEVTVTDGDGGSSNTATATADLNTLENDDPSNAGTLPTDIAVTEDVLSNIDLSAIDFADPDANASELTVTLATSTGGQLTLANAAGITLGGTATSATVTGTLADLNAYFNNTTNIQYLHGTAQLNGDNADTLTVSVVDNGNTGSGGGGSISLGTVNIDITAVNDAPAGLPLITGTVTEDQILTADTSGISDIDGLGAFSYQWLRGGVAIAGATSNTYTLGDADVGNLISVRVDYTDGDGFAESLTSAQTAAVVNINDAPVLSVADTPILYLTGTMAIDPALTVTDVDDTMLESAQVWFGDGFQRGHDRLRFVDQLGITGSYNNNTGILTLTGTASVADYETALRSVEYEDANPTPAQGIVYVNFSVFDGTDTSNIDTRVLEIVDNLPPRVGDDTVTVAEGSVSVIDVSANDTDAEASLDLTSIVITTAPTNGNVIVNGDGTVTYTHNDSETTADTFGYTIKDTDGNVSSEGFVFVTVTAVNDSPTVSTNTGVTVAEGSTGTVITNTMLNEADPDDDGAELTYTVTTATGNGALRLSGVALGVNDTVTQADIDAGILTYDHNGSETISDSFSFSLADGGEDGAAAASGTFNITVTAVNDAPTATITPTSYSATEQVALTVHGTGLSIGDVDDGGAVVEATLSVVSGTLNATAGTTGVTVGGDGTSTLTLTGTVSQINTLLAGNMGATLSYIDSSDNPPASDTLTLQIDDLGNTGAGGALTGSDTATINITAVDDAPLINDVTTSVAEDAANTTAVANLNEANTGNDTDPDGTALTYSITAGDADGIFAIDANTGEITVADNTNLDYETTQQYVLTVEATDGINTDTAAITIDITDVNESAVGPVTDNDGTADTVAEDATVGTTVGITGLATDADGTDTVTYSLSDDAGGLFTIDTNTGVITVANALDYETATSHSVTVLATSSDTSTSSQAFTINVTDVNESAVGPVSDSDAAANTVAEDAIVGTTVGITGLATDADGTDTVTYSLSDDAGGLFTIDANSGVITVANALDYETATSHSVTVLATSSDASTSSQVFTIAVTDVNESAVGPVTDSDGTADTVAEDATVGTSVGVTGLATDADGTDTVTYSLSDDAGGLFTIDANTGVITVANALDYETATSHSVTVLATSSDTSTSSQAFTINVTDVNESAVGPVIDNDAAANTVAEDAIVGTTVGITGLATDADGTDTVTYSLSDDAGGLFTIDTNTGIITVANALDYETATSHSVTVLATSSDTSTSSQAFSINVTDVNESVVGPVSDSDAAANTVAEDAIVGTSVGITGLATDADGTDTVTYSLSDDAGGLFTIDSNTGVITVANALDYEAATSHSVTVLATSSDASTSSQAFTINVTDVNESAVGPVSDSDAAGDTVAEDAIVGTSVGVTGLATDADGTDTVTYSLSDDAGGLFSIDTNTGIITVANALDYETATSHSVTVLATSSDASTSSQAFTINVTDVNESAVGPVTDNDGTADTVAENALIGDSVGITGLATDADGTDTVTYSLSDDAGGLFTIDTNTGVITVANALDYETATSHSVTVLATSSDTSTSSQAFTISVTDVNESAVGPVSDSDAAGDTVAEDATVGTTVGITGLATDADGTDTVTYSLSDDAGGLFTIDTNTGVITVANALDYETAASHSVTVLATSSDTSTSSQAFTIAVTDVNESAVGPVTDSDGTADTVAEDAIVGTTVGITGLATDADGTDTVTYSLSDDAGGLFSIDANTGVITVANALDYETATSHSVTVLATSSDASTSSQAFSIAVTDVNEFAVGPVSDSDAAGDTVAEDAIVGTSVGVTGLATDADGTDTVTYSLSDDAGGLFTIDANTGVITVANALDYETATSHSVTVLATSSDTSTSSQAFTIAVTDVNESAIGPVTDNDGAVDTVAEDAIVGTAVGITGLATDPDGTDTVTYSLSDDAGGLFSIDTSTGVITVANALDYETAISHSVTVLATSSDTSTSSQAFTINVTDINESAVGPVTDNDGTADTIAEDATVGTSVGITGLATDADGTDTVTYSLSDDAGGLFAIDTNTGVITVANALDYETATSHSVTVLATSSDTSTSSQAFTINVTDVNESAVGPVTDNDGTADTVAEDATVGTSVGITGLATDADGTDTVTYSLSDDAGGLFAIDTNTGIITVANALDYETATSHSVTVLATSSDTSTSSQAFTINVTDVNESAVGPVTDNDAAANTVAENALVGDSVGITGLATDADGTDTVTYSLSDDAGGLFTIDTNTGVITVANALDYETATSHSVTVLATSSDTSTSSQAFTIAVTDVNESAIGPVTDSDAAADTVAEDATVGTSVGITGLASDPDGADTVTYSLSDDAGGLFTIDINTGVITVANALDYESATSHSVTVLATSSDTSTSSQAFTIAVTDVNESAVGPVTDNDGTADTVAEDAIVGTTVGVTGLATDADGTDTVTYSLSDDAGGLFTIDSNTGVITVANALDYESATSHSVTVLATSSDTSTSSQAFTISVTDVNESAVGPVTDNDGAADTVAEDAIVGTTVGVTGLATDADGTDSVTYSLSDDAGGLFTIDSNTGVITVANALDYESATSHSVTVLATSSDTSTSSQAFTINVTDINESAVGPVTDNDAAANTVAENALVGDSVGITGLATDADGTDTVTYSLSDDAGGLFTIDINTGVITVANALDYETATSHSVTVLATSSDTSTSSQAFTINVTDINESAVGPVSDSDAAANTVAEDAIVGTSVGVTGLATDADGTDTVTYSLSDDAGGLFTIDTNTGVITVANALDYETATSHSVTVLATSSDTSTSSQAFTIAVTDVNESAIGPVTDNDGAVDTVAEDAIVGTAVGITGLATDADGTDTVTYSLSDNAGGLFSIDANSGVITVANALDYETATSHSVTVLATSSDTSTSSQAFTINVTDINESAVGPVTDNDAAANTVAEDATVGTTVGITGLATDADGTDTVTYSLSDDAGGLFSIDANTGVITVANALDYETATSHNITVLATSSDLSTSSQVFSISVTDVNEAPAFTSSVANAATEDTGYSYTITATDPDSGASLTITATTLPAWLTLVDNGDGTATLSGTPSNAEVGGHAVVLDVSDGALTDTQSFTITVANTNDAPNATVDSFTVNEGSTTNLNLAANDTDADDGLDLTSITIVSAPTNGTIVVNADGTVDYSHDGSETVTDSFTYTINDASGATSTVGTVNLTIDPVNDAPIHSVPAAQSTPSNTPLIFSSPNGNAITVADPDASGAAMEVTLSVSNGTLSLAGTSGLSFNAGDGTGDASMTFTGTAADINTALNGLSFQADADYEGMATVQIITDDLGNVGTGGALNAMDRVNITVAASAPAASPQDTLPPLDELIAEIFDIPEPEPVITPVNRENVNPAAEEVTDAATPASGSDTTTPTSDAVVDAILGSGRGVPTQADVSLPGLVELFDQNLQPHDDDRPSSVRLISHVIRQGLVDPFTYAKMLNPLQPDAAIWESIEAMMEQMDGRDTSWYSDDQVLTTTTATGLTVSFTVGYVSWLLRAGYLSASLLSVVPLWREFDPLPVLTATTKKKKGKSSDRVKDSQKTNDIEPESIFASSETD